MAILVLLLCSSASMGQEAYFISSNALKLESDAYPLPAANVRRGLLETTKITVGTIYKSHHFDDENYNESHNGIYLSVENWSIGTYENSGNAQSVFVTYNPNLYQTKTLQVDLVAGVADGYHDWKYARDEYLPILGVSAQWMNLKAMVSPAVVALGIELPLN